MSYNSPKRQPLSLVHNKSNSTTSTAGSGSPGSSTLRKKLPSIGALTSLHTSPKASLETSREGRASLSFSPFEPYRLPTAPSATTSSDRDRDSGKLRARATTVSIAALTSSAAPSTPFARQNHGENVRSPPRTVAALGPARRTRSKTLSKSQSHASTSSSSSSSRPCLVKRTFSQHEDTHNRHLSCGYLEDDTLQRTLDPLEHHVEEQGRRLSLSSSSGWNASHTPMLSAPMMQRRPVTPMSNAAVAATHAVSGWSSRPQQTTSLSPPTLLPPYMPAAPDPELVYPTTSPGSSLASSTSSQSSSVCQATLTPQVEQLSNLISDLSLFLPQADSLSSDQLQAIQTAVDSILGKTTAPAQPSLGNAIQLRNDIMSNLFADDMPTLHVGGIPSSLHNAPPTSFGPAQILYDPSTPQDVDMLDMSSHKSHFSHSQTTHDVQGGMTGLQVQHNPPPYQARIDFSSLDYDLGLAPPRW